MSYFDWFNPVRSEANRYGGGMSVVDKPSFSQLFSTQQARAPASGFWDKLKSNTADYFTNPENVFKFGAGALGGGLSYLSARQANKRQAQRDAANLAFIQRQNARYDKADATRAKYDEALPVELALEQNTPEEYARTGTYYRNNALSANRAGGQQLNRVFAAKGGYMDGGTAGQSDKIPAMLSDGEFVMDADTVAALGDGNNAAGASALEQMRQNIRKHKRSAPKDKIPPKAKKPEQYLKKGK
jgi:hypothetical protein